ENEVSDTKGQHYLRRITLYRTDSNRIEGLVLTFTNITPISEAMNQLKTREKQQALVAKFGQQALSEPNLDVLFAKAVQWTAEAVNVEMCKLLELQDHGQLFLRAGVGWKAGLVGHATLSASHGSQGGFTLARKTPVIVEDLTTEQRFDGPELLLNHQVKSGMTVIIGPHGDPYGVLGVHTREQRHFNQEDVNFIQAMANGLWAAIQHRQTLEKITAQAAALRDREEWLRLALTSAELTSSWIDLTAKQVSQYKPTSDEVPSEPPAATPLEVYLSQVHEADRDRLKQVWRQANDDHGSFVTEYRVHRNGNIHWLRGWGQYVDLQGQPRIAGISMDISQEKETRARLQAAKREADASNQAKSAFLANMSHEIRTPLTAILGYADLIHMEEGGRRKSDDYVHKIKTNGQNLLEIINDVLDLSKVEANRIEINKQPFAVKNLLAELLSLMHLRAKEKQLEFRIETEGEIPAVLHTDMSRLKQILINLISNAVKFTDSGSVRLLVSAQSSPDKQDTSMTFKVVDTGIGIDDKLLGKIFDPFEQADSSVATNYGGTGLGLTISKRITHLLGGNLEVESVMGKGSTFTLTLPIGSTVGVEYIAMEDANALVQQHSAPSINARLLAGVHVLVVDDVADILVLIQQILKNAGAAVSVASNGREAIERIESCAKQGKPVDMVLMDTMMPVMDGYTAVKRLRQEGFKKPIIALTAAAMTNDRNRCLQAGCDDYLPKPVNVEALLSILATQVADAPVKKGARVLIIEDNLDAGEAIQTLLSLSGYECRHVATGESGIVEARHFRPEVILLDLTLPDMDGYGVAEHLHDPNSPFSPRIIALSGQDLESQKEKLKAAGFDSYLQKPVGRDSLATYFPALAETRQLS
ncbi:MAG: response regulator, partial [Cellvibrionaceae bacterium]